MVNLVYLVEVVLVHGEPGVAVEVVLVHGKPGVPDG